MDHNRVTSMNIYVPPDTWCHKMRLKKYGYKQITTCLAANINPTIVGYMKNKISLVNELNI